MSTWLIDTPQQLTLDGDISKLDVWLANGKVRVVGTDGPARLDVRKVGRKGITVSMRRRRALGPACGEAGRLAAVGRAFLVVRPG